MSTAGMDWTWAIGSWAFIIVCVAIYAWKFNR